MHRIMYASVVALALVGSPGAALAQEVGLVGTWQGTLDAGMAQLRIVFHIERAEDGSYAGTIDSPDQGAFGYELSSVEVDGRSVTFGVALFGASYTGTVSGEEIAGTFSQAGADLPLTLTRTEEAPEAPPRPQEPKPPFPYESVDVTFPNPDADIDLAGTVTLPPGPGPFPGVVLVSGSGAQDRDESLLGHKPFLVLADHLTRSGIAVLRYDDRGVGESGGDFSATSEDFTSDALAAVSYLRGHQRVAAGRVGIAGHSEGGLIGPMAANRSDDVAFVVMLAGPGLPGLEILVAQGRLINEAAGSPAEVVEMNVRVQRGLAAITAEEPDDDAAATRMRALMRREFDALSPAIRAAAGDALGDEAIDASIQRFNSAWVRFFVHHDPRPRSRRSRTGSWSASARAGADARPGGRVSAESDDEARDLTTRLPGRRILHARYARPGQDGPHESPSNDR